MAGAPAWCRCATVGGMRRWFLRSLLLAVVGFSTLFALEFLLEWRRAGFPGPSARS